VYPVNALDYESNFLNMMFAVPAEPYRVDPTSRPPCARCSSCMPTTSRTAPHRPSAGRIVRSNLYVSISAGIAALWGPLHGGANQEVLEMLEQIAADGGDVNRAVERAKDKNHRSG
jgi:citrate synthase